MKKLLIVAGMVSGYGGARAQEWQVDLGRVYTETTADLMGESSSSVDSRSPWGEGLALSFNQPLTEDLFVDTRLGYSQANHRETFSDTEIGSNVRVHVLNLSEPRGLGQDAIFVHGGLSAHRFHQDKASFDGLSADLGLGLKFLTKIGTLNFGLSYSQTLATNDFNVEGTDGSRVKSENNKVSSLRTTIGIGVKI